MNNLKYDCCPRCGNKLYFRPIASLFDPDGRRFGFQLFCKECTWFDWDRFYSYREVRENNDVTEG